MRAVALAFVLAVTRSAAGEPRAPSALELELGGGVTSRHFDYTDDIFLSLRNYELDAAPLIFAGARWYPLAHEGNGDLANLGVVGRYAQVFPPTALTRDGRHFDSSANEFFMGLRGRAPIDEHELGVTAGYGQQRFEISGDEAAPLLPDVAYEYLRVAAEAELRFGEFRAGAELGKRFVLATGELETPAWFPHVSPDAIDARAFVGHALLEDLELRAGVAIVRYFFAMNPQPDDVRVAGGAVDQYLSGWVAVTWRMRGASGKRE